GLTLPASYCQRSSRVGTAHLPAPWTTVGDAHPTSQAERNLLMKKRRGAFAILQIILLALILVVRERPAQAYVEIPYALGRLIAESTNIVLVRMEKVDKERNLIVYRKVADIKGTHPGDVIKHSIGHGGFHPREWQFVM